MKKLLALVTASAMVLSLVACGSTADTSTATTTESSSSTESASTDTASADAAATDSSASGDALTIDDVWPEGTTVTIDVPAKAGGGTDIYTRYATAALQELCPGVNFVVNNYETSEVGMQHCVNADPDGTTLLVNHGGAIIQYLCGSSDTNVDGTDLAVVGILNAGGPQAIIARPDAPYSTLTEWGEYVAEHPMECTVGCSLGGASQIVLYNTLEAAAPGHGMDVNYVQCASEADKLTQTASGSIDIANCSVPNAQAYEADGKLKILGVTGPEACTLESMSELVGTELGDTFKTTVEQGIDFTYDSSYYFFVPAGTPENVQEAINSVLAKLPTVQSFEDGMASMATYTCEADLDKAREMLADEWEMQDAACTALGLKVR